MDATSRQPFSLFLLGFVGIIFVLKNCEGRSDKPNRYFQSTHENDPVPADYPHQDEFPGSGTSSGPGSGWPIGNPPRPTFPNPSSPNTNLIDIRTEKMHEIFLRDRVVRSVCKSLASFVQTGVLPQGRVKRLSADTKESRCGWWKSVPSGPADGSCGFEWVKCSDVDSGPKVPTSPEDLSSIMDPLRQVKETEPAAAPLGEPGDESELNLRLPSPAEWQRRLNSTFNAVNKEDD